jgi:hypothetical protein
MRFPVVLFALLATASSIEAAPLAAQRLESSPFPTFDTGRGNVGGMILGGVALGAAGLFGGALVGDRFQRFPCEDCIEGAFYGALAGESLAIPLGVHLADRRRGNLAPALAASLGIGALGLGAAALTDEWGILLAIPVVQVAASIGIERHTARARP